MFHQAFSDDDGVKKTSQCILYPRIKHPGVYSTEDVV